MKTILIAITLVLVPVSLVGASTTNSVLAMTQAPYMKWQSGLTSVEAPAQSELIQSLSEYLGGKGAELKSVTGELQRSGLDYGAREIDHLSDVRSVFNKVRLANRSSLLILAISLVLLLAFKGVIFTLKMVYKLCFIMVFLLLALVVASYVGFDKVFGAMHQTFFKEGTWVFPDTSFFIKLFPYDFWKNSATLAYTGSIGQIAGLGLVSRFILKRLST